MILSDSLKDIILELKKLNYEGNSCTGIFTSLRNKPYILEEIKLCTNFLDNSYSKVELGQRLYHLRENIKKLELCQCTYPKKFHRISNGYFNTCGSSECKIESKSKSFKKTIKEKYGESYFKEGSISRDKYKSTMISKYGVDHNFKSIDVRESIKNTLLERHGVDSPLKNKEIKEKRNSTCIERYGTKDFLNSEKSKNTNFLKYGSTNPMRNKEISKKVSDLSSETKRNILSLKLKKYSIDLLEYSTNKCDLFCNKCNNTSHYHSVTINAKLRSSICPCIYCNPNTFNRSKMENDLLDYIKSIYKGDVKTNDRSLFIGSSKFSECDIYLPDLSVAFEFNGIYWHSEIYKQPEYHQEKSTYLLEKGIKLYHIWEDDWIYKNDIIKSMISSSIGISINKIYARKCKIDDVNKKEYKDFCDNNHLKGYCPASKVIGLYFENELVSIMSFSKTRKLIDSKNTNYEYELIRSCTKKNFIVIGGISRIIKRFKDEIGKSLVTYCDVSFSPDPHSTSYHKTGFNLLSKTKPGYYWVIDGKKSNRLNWTKSKLISLGYDSNKTADSIMNSLGYYKIWDCGNYKFELL
jgi:hypothetical protein